MANISSASTGQRSITTKVETELEKSIAALHRARKIARSNPNNKIWFRLIPLKKLIQLHYEAVIISATNHPKKIQSDELIVMGKSLLDFIKELKSNSLGLTEDPDVQFFLKTFEKLFPVILAAAPNCPNPKSEMDDDGFDGFLDSVWKDHTEGNIDFTQVTVIQDLLKASTRHLEDILATSINSWDPQNRQLHSTAILTPHNFQTYLHLLHKIYNHYNHPPNFLNFVRDFIKTLSFPSKLVSIQFYPTPFQPLLALLFQFQNNSNNLTKNHPIVPQILSLTNDLFTENPPEVYPFITFVLKSHEDLFNLLIQAATADLITFRHYPFLWKINLTG